MKLNNGKDIPNIGLGTWNIKNSVASEAVQEAVKVGYRHFDSARVYFNEQGVGDGIRSCGLPREDLFVTSKIFPGFFTYRNPVKAIEKSLKRSGLDYFDLMLIHWPRPQIFASKNKHYFNENLKMWRAYEDAYKQGKLKAIGVSNFEIEDLKHLIEHAEIKPMVNQIRVHIGHTPLELIAFCQKEGIVVEAYSPIARGRENHNEAIKKIADQYKVSVPQLFIKYTLQLGLVTLPKTSNPSHMEENLNIDFVITNEDMDKLKAIDFDK